MIHCIPVIATGFPNGNRMVSVQLHSGEHIEQSLLLYFGTFTIFILEEKGKTFKGQSGLTKPEVCATGVCRVPDLSGLTFKKLNPRVLDYHSVEYSRS